MMRKMGVSVALWECYLVLKNKETINESDVDDKLIIHQEAIISSMTKQERRYPKKWC